MNPTKVNKILVVGDRSNKVEILDIIQNKWYSGPQLPGNDALLNGVLVAGDGKTTGAFFLEGKDRENKPSTGLPAASATVYMLSSNLSTWKILENTLKIPRTAPIAVGLPGNFLSGC